MGPVIVFDATGCYLVEKLDARFFLRGEQILHSKLAWVVEAVDLIECPVLIRSNHFKRLSALPQCYSILWKVPSEGQVAKDLIQRLATLKLCFTALFNFIHPEGEAGLPELRVGIVQDDIFRFTVPGL